MNATALATADWDMRRKEFQDRVCADWRASGLRYHAPRALASAEIDGLEQLLMQTKTYLLALPGMGRHSFYEIEYYLSDKGWVFFGKGRPIRRTDYEAIIRLQALGWRISPPAIGRLASPE